jgi:transcription elongation factor Elf1
MNYDPYGDLKHFEPFKVPFRIQSTFKWVEIRECPWCGEREVIITFGDIKDNQDRILCPTCQCYLRDYTKLYRKHFRKLLLKRYFKSLLGI